MIPGILDQIAAIQRQREEDARREHRDLESDRRRRAHAGQCLPRGPRPKPRRNEYLAHARKELAKIKESEFKASVMVACLPVHARGDAYRYIEMLLRDGVVLKGKRGWYRKP